MRIAIVGAGWVGCHLAAVLMNEHEIILIDKESQPFCGTSQINQNRLHLGYHYARNHSTREMCRATFLRFMDDYGHLVDPVEANWYAVPEDESLLDYGTIATIFSNGWDHEKVEAPFLRRTEAIIATKECFISPLAAQRFFSNLLQDVFWQETIYSGDIDGMMKQYDLVLDCTNNTLLKPSLGDYFEAVAMFLYKKKKPLPFDALTYIDGPLFSFYPYEHGLVSLSHVEESVIDSSVRPIDGRSCSPQLLEQARKRAEQHAQIYWPEMKDYLDYEDTVVSTKSKHANASANRAPLFWQQDNLLSIFTGKIQGIYAIEDRVRQTIQDL